MFSPLHIAALVATTWALGACAEDAGARRRVERVLGPLPGALLAVAGSDEGTMWVAGADAGDGRGAYLGRRVRGSAEIARVDLREIDPRGGALWWVHVVGPDHVLAAGDHGRVVEVVDGVARRVETGTEVQLYGVARSQAGVIVAVGGAPATVVVIVPGAAAELATLPDDMARDTRLFKVFASPDGTFEVIGERGAHMIVALLESSPTPRVTIASRPVPGAPRLVTIHGDGRGSRIAVGGSLEGYAVEMRADGTFRDISPRESPLLNGVFVGARTFAVGFLGAVYERRGGDWRRVDEIDWGFDSHAVWVDREGVAWLAGGRLLDGTLTQGALWRVGPEPVPALTNGDLAVDAHDATSSGDVMPEVVDRCPEMPPAIGLELGERDARGCFEAFVAGGPAVVVNGPQGGSHVELAVRLPEVADGVGRIELEATLVIDESTIARFATRELPIENDVVSSATRVTTDVPVIFAGADPSPWVGRTARLTCAVVAGQRAFSAAVDVTLIR